MHALIIFSLFLRSLLVDPPWSEYKERCPGAVIENMQREVWTPDEIMNLRVELIANSPSFLFLWCGSGGEALEHGRKILRKWYLSCSNGLQQEHSFFVAVFNVFCLLLCPSIRISLLFVCTGAFEDARILRG